MRDALAGLVLVASLSGCATAPAPSERGQAEDRSGFTVPENVDVDADVAADFATAIKHLNTGEYEQGAALLRQVTERSPQHTAPYINLAMAYQKLNRLPAAEEAIKQALQLNPAHPVANTEYGLIYRKTGRFAEARAAYERVLQRYPAYLPARKNLGILCDIYLRDRECALSQYRIYSSAVPDDKTVQLWIADLERQSAR